MSKNSVEMSIHLDDEKRMKQRVQAVTFDGISKEQLLDGYRKWAGSYEQDLSSVNTVGHNIVAKYACQCFPTEARSTVRIIDVGAGTGLVGVELHKSGFRNIDALDPCKEMLDKARQKGIYKNYILAFLSDEKLNIPKGTYDGLVGSGIFAEAGHVPVCALHEMIRLVKSGKFCCLFPATTEYRKQLNPFIAEFVNSLDPDLTPRNAVSDLDPNCLTLVPIYRGYIVLVTRASLVAENAPYKELEPLMCKLEEEGKWKRTVHAIGPNMYLDRPAITWCYQVI